MFVYSGHQDAATACTRETHGQGQVQGEWGGHSEGQSESFCLMDLIKQNLKLIHAPLDSV